MKIVHICSNVPYTDNWGYQENIMPKYHKMAGHEVTLLARNDQYDESDRIIPVNCGTYYTKEGVKIIRQAPLKLFFDKLTKLFQFYPIYDTLCAERPDFILQHGFIGSISALSIRKYIKKINPNCKAVCDIHQTMYNAGISRNALNSYIVKLLRRFLNKIMFPYYSELFYITPACKNYAIEYYHAPENKLALLPLGYDPCLIDNVHPNDIRKILRKKYGIGEDDILLVHGGKIIPRRKTFELIQAVSELNDPQLKLIIFGGLADEYMEPMKQAQDKYTSWLKYVGSLTQQDYCNLYLASDIAVFPGGESSIWQEAIGSGLPLLIYHWEGVEYLDRGGNIAYLQSQDVSEIKRGIQSILKDKRYIDMAKITHEKAAEFFSYERIADRVLECTK